MKENKGITLIALVITIIVLLILAAVSIATLTGENGILTQAQIASEKTKFANEKEAIEFVLADIEMSNYLGEDKKSNIGKKLYDKNVENENKWDVVIEKETGTTYGTGCTFIPKGTFLSDGSRAKSNWIIDKNGNIKELADDSFIKLDCSSPVEITDGLVLNMDAANFDDVQEDWGNNISLRYYDEQGYNTVEKRKISFEQQKKEFISVSQKDDGYDRQISKNTNNYISSEANAFKFNGNNYIEIYNKDGFDFSKGFTFEFYGNIKDGTFDTFFSELHVCPLLSLWDGFYEHNVTCRFSFDTKNTDYFWFTLKPGMHTDSDWTDSKNKENQIFKIENFLNNDIYLTLNFEPNGDKRTIQKLYLNGKILSQSDISKECYEEFVEATKTANYIDIGRADLRYCWKYSLGLCVFFMLCFKNI